MPNRQPIRTSSRSPNSSSMPAPSRSRRSRTARSSSGSGTARSPLPTLLLSNGSSAERRHVREAGEVTAITISPDFRNHGNPGLFLSSSAIVEIRFTGLPASTSPNDSAEFSLWRQCFPRAFPARTASAQAPSGFRR